MKLSAYDEYGLKLLLRIARGEPEACMTTALLAEREGISMSHAGKVLRLLRQGGFVKASRGNCGGYVLTRPPQQLNLGEVLAALGGRLFDDGFCQDHTAGERLCTNSVDCSVRSLWRLVQGSVDELLYGLTLHDFLTDDGGLESAVVRVGGTLPTTA